MTFSASPADLEKLGFRLIPTINKDPPFGISGFGAEFPTYTVRATAFGPGHVPAILGGACPGLAPDWLLILDRDGDAQWSDLGLPELPPTLSSKGDRHRYFRVPPGELRDQLGQWRPIFGGKEPKIDIVWAGGYACEPNAWDTPPSVAAIATLPEEWLRALLDKRGDAARARKPKKDRGLPPPKAEVVEMSALPVPAVEALAGIWPKPGEGCHRAALSLGGWLAQSDWALPDVLRFASAVFSAARVDNRLSQVAYSWTNRRLDPDAHVFGLRTLVQHCSGSKAAKDAAIKIVRGCVPGLEPFELDTASLIEARYGAEPEKKAMALALTAGTHAEVARDILRRFLPRSVYAEGKLWRRGADGVWVEVDDAALARLVAKYDGLEYNVTKSGFIQSYRAEHKPVRDWISRFRAKPRFFEGAPAGVPFKNGFMAWRGEEFELVPLRVAKTRYVLPFDWTSRPTVAPSWAAFVRSVWGGDGESIALLHEVLGYLICGTNRAHKMFAFVGPARAGKGTVIRVLEKILSGRCAPFKVSQLAKGFSLARLAGKLVAVDADMRAPRGEKLTEIVETLLNISGGDQVVVDRKFRDEEALRLPARILIAANPPFGLSDSGTAVAGRFVVLTFPRSFLGSEDLQLERRLEAELPGIVALAMGGLVRLARQGWRFTVPAASAADREMLAHIENPMLCFFEERCEMGESFVERANRLYQAAQEWREENGHHGISSQMFGAAVRKLMGVSQDRERDSDGRQYRVYQGIRLRPPVERQLGLVPQRVDDTM